MLNLKIHQNLSILVFNNYPGPEIQIISRILEPETYHGMNAGFKYPFPGVGIALISTTRGSEKLRPSRMIFAGSQFLIGVINHVLNGFVQGMSRKIHRGH